MFFNKKRIQKENEERERRFERERQREDEQRQEASQRLNNGLNKIVIDAIREHLNTLTRKRTNLVLTDEYGLIEDKSWQKEMEYFYEKVIKPNSVALLYQDFRSHVTKTEVTKTEDYKIKAAAIDFADRELKPQVIKDIDANIQKFQAQLANDSKTLLPTNPYEYEGYCCKLLEGAGWQASATAKSGDQGADVIAKRNGVVLILQCKLWDSPVGNKAVQEIAAAKRFYSAEVAAVVSNQPFTPSAKLLAQANGVFLLHHNDLVEQFANGRPK